jgi:hypothetical protein
MEFVFAALGILNGQVRKALLQHRPTQATILDGPGAVRFTLAGRLSNYVRGAQNDRLTKCNPEFLTCLEV